MDPIKANFMTPIRNFYSRTAGYCQKNCFGTLSHLLFRDHFRDEDPHFDLTSFMQSNSTVQYDLFSVQPTELPLSH